MVDTSNLQIIMEKYTLLGKSADWVSLFGQNRRIPAVVYNLQNMSPDRC